MSVLTFESELERVGCAEFADALRKAKFDVHRLKTITMNDLDDAGVPRVRRRSIVFNLTGRDPEQKEEDKLLDMVRVMELSLTAQVLETSAWFAANGALLVRGTWALTQEVFTGTSVAAMAGRAAVAAGAGVGLDALPAIRGGADFAGALGQWTYSDAITAPALFVLFVGIDTGRWLTGRLKTDVYLLRIAEHTIGVAFGAMGGVYGGLAGAALGTMVAGPIGTIIGGVLGTIIGGFFADFIGRLGTKVLLERSGLAAKLADYFGKRDLAKRIVKELGDAEKLLKVSSDMQFPAAIFQTRLLLKKEHALGQIEEVQKRSAQMLAAWQVMRAQFLKKQEVVQSLEVPLKLEVSKQHEVAGWRLNGVRVLRQSDPQRQANDQESLEYLEVFV